MFSTCVHTGIADSLETISAAFAIFEVQRNNPERIALVSANSLFEHVTARPVIDCVGCSLAELVPRHVEKQMRPSFLLCLARQYPQETELVIEREGVSRWWRVMISPILRVNGTGQRMIVTLIEISEKKALEQQLELARLRYEAIVETAYDGIITIDPDQTIKMLNQSARTMFGIGDDTVVGDPLSRFIPQRFHERHAQHVDSFRESTVAVRPMQSRSPLFGRRADGREIEIEATISKIKVGNQTEMTAVVRDISERTKMLEQLKQAATCDSLTGIFNRRHGTAVLGSEINRSKRFKHDLTLAIFDLDHFKSINDSHGHDGGDRVLNSVVAAIAKTLRAADTFCRWGGEEFLVILPETPLAEAMHWAERAREAVAAQTVDGAGGEAITTTVSLGLAAIAAQDSTPEDLLRRADKALYRAKENGRNQVVAAPD